MKVEIDAGSVTGGVETFPGGMLGVVFQLGVASLFLAGFIPLVKNPPQTQLERIVMWTLLLVGMTVLLVFCSYISKGLIG